ncbi:hypothetical protein NC651_011846 [Populus alba x Populus x berolinensis]|nr:hypothetical protein NC651_011846 [Populus alba x Populus x berolinensis]
MDLPMDAKIFKSKVNLLVLAESANWSGIEETLRSSREVTVKSIDKEEGSISIESEVDPKGVVEMLEGVEKHVYIVNLDVESKIDPEIRDGSNPWIRQRKTLRVKQTRPREKEGGYV